MKISKETGNRLLYKPIYHKPMDINERLGGLFLWSNPIYSQKDGFKNKIIVLGQDKIHIVEIKHFYDSYFSLGKGV